MNLGLLHQTYPEIEDPKSPARAAREALSLKAYLEGTEKILGGAEGISELSGEHTACAVGCRVMEVANELVDELEGLELAEVL